MPISPIVWLDEAMLASYTHSFIEGNGISMELDEGAPVPIYGPVFFLLASFSIKLFGFVPFSFRLVNCLFGYLSVFVLGKILEENKIRNVTKYWLLLLYATDVSFIMNSHAGRMELVAIFFVLIAYWVYLKKSIDNIWKSIILSLDLTLAFMTTPRSMVLIIPIAVYFLLLLYSERSWKNMIYYLVIPIVLYGIWIAYAFGSVGQMIDFYIKPNETSQNVSFASRFISFSVNIVKWHYPIVLAGIFILVDSLRSKYFKSVLLYFIPIILFYLLVKDMGGYDIYIIPFYLIIIGIGVEQLIDSPRKTSRIVTNCSLILCFIVNLGVFSIKVINLVATKDQRDHDKMCEWFNNTIPANSRIAGGYPYYYAAINHGCQYRRLERDNLSPGYTFTRLLNNYKPEYLLIHKQQFTPDEEACFKMFKTERVSSYVPIKNTNRLSRMFSGFGEMFNVSYEGELYRVIYKD